MTGVLDQITGSEPGVTAILQRHFDLMRATSPEESCHVLPPDALFDDKTIVIVWREAGKVIGIGALRALDDTHGELKSMHTLQEARGKGVARAILHGLIQAARDAGLRRISLETGSTEEFISARNLYLREGFVDCPPFGCYVVDPLSVFMTREI